jgi:hypothetical protein
MTKDPRVDEYISTLPDWQQAICNQVRQIIHQAEPEVVETIKFTNRPYFTLQGNVCAFLATKDHVNVFIYDPVAPDPTGLINQGQGNSTARNIQFYKDQNINQETLSNLIRAVVVNNRAGGWRKMRKST